MSPSENFDIIDQLYWMEEPRKVYCGPIKVERLARIGVLEDTKNSIKILIWGTLTETINESKTNKFSNVTCNFFNDLRIYTNSSTREQHNVAIFSNTFNMSDKDEDYNETFLS